MGRGLWSNHERSISLTPRWSLHLVLFLIAGFSSTQVVVALDANPKSNFTFPNQDGMTFYQKDVVLVSYVSSFPEPLLFAWCKGSDGVKQAFAKEPAAGFNGTQPVLIDFTSDGECWWNLRRIFDTPDGANGPAFKLSSSERDGGPQTISRESPPKPTSSPSTDVIVTNSPPSSPNLRAQPSTTSTIKTSLTNPTGTESPTSSSAPTSTGLLRSDPTASMSTSMKTTSTSPTSSTPSSQSNTNTDNTNTSSKSGLSTGAAAGIGVAVGVAILILFISVVIFVRRWKSTVIAEALKASNSNAATPAGTPPYPVHASLNDGTGTRGGHVQMNQTAVEAYTPTAYETLARARGPGQGAGSQRYYYVGVGIDGQPILKPPEEMDVEPHTAEMEGDSTYGAKFQREEYR